MLCPLHQLWEVPRLPSQGKVIQHVGVSASHRPAGEVYASDAPPMPNGPFLNLATPLVLIQTVECYQALLAAEP